MPTIEFGDETIEADAGDDLRSALIAAGLTPHNGATRYANCHGNGVCGTCAVEIVEGDVSPPTRKERRRLTLPPHDPDAGLRLACQLPVEADLVVRKYPGYWGQKTEHDGS